MAEEKRALRKKREVDMLNGPLTRRLIVYTIPIILSGILQLLFNAADLIVVGRFAGSAGSNCIAAVGSTSAISNLVVSLFMGLSVGVNVLVARYFAQQDAKNCEETIATSVAYCLAVGALLAVIGVVLAKPLLSIMGTPEDVLPLATLYMRIYFVGMPMQMLYNFGSAILRAVGDTQRPLYFLTAAGVINVLLNLFFVIVLHRTVDGVALATILSQSVSALLVTGTLVKSDGMYHLDLRRIRFVKDKIFKMTQIGLPAGLQSTVFSLSNSVMQSSINSFGSAVMAGNSAAQSIEGFVWISMNAVYQTSISFTAANYAVRQYDRVKKIYIRCLLIVFAVGFSMGNIFHYFGRPLLSIYTSSPETIEYGMHRMAMICMPYFLCGMMDTTCGGIRGMGDSISPMIISMLGACGLRILWIVTIFQMYHTQTVLYFAMPLSWGVTFAAQLVCYIIVYRKNCVIGARA